MAGRATVRIEKDTGGAGVEAMLKRLGRGDQRVLVGVPTKAGNEENGASVAFVAACTEFGTSTAPARPFLRGGIRTALPVVRRVARRDLAAVAEGGMAMVTALERAGAIGGGSVKEYMAGPHFVPNAPSTIARKGSSQPTIEDGQLRQSITHVVEAGAGR